MSGRNLREELIPTPSVTPCIDGSRQAARDDLRRCLRASQAPVASMKRVLQCRASSARTDSSTSAGEARLNSCHDFPLFLETRVSEFDGVLC